MQKCGKCFRWFPADKVVRRKKSIVCNPCAGVKEPKVKEPKEPKAPKAPREPKPKKPEKLRFYTGDEFLELFQCSELLYDAGVITMEALKSAPPTPAFLYYYGGKKALLPWLLPILEWPENPGHGFIDAFGGSGTVLLGRSRAQSEILNDKDTLLVNFHRVMRNWPEELADQLELMPWSRQQYNDSWDNIQRWRALTRDEQLRYLYPMGAEPLEEDVKAEVVTTAVWLRTLQCAVDYGNFVQQGFAHKTALKSWAPSYSVYAQNNRRNNLRLDKVMPVARRLSNVTIENMDVLDLIAATNKVSDAHNWLLYCDPPYTFSSRKDTALSQYFHEMEDEAHVALCDALLGFKGRVALSGYENELYSRKFGDWYIYRRTHSYTGGTWTQNVDREKTEVVWCNYEPSRMMRLEGL